MKTLIFKTQLLREKRIQREIEVPENYSLYRLAAAILDAYDFNFDHCFGFFSNITESWAIVDSEKKYELFTDLIEEGENIEPTGADSVKKTKIKDVWKEPRDQMLFYFDYGDDWRWIITLKTFGQKQKGTTYPRTLSTTGTAPEQYPKIEE